MVRINLRQRLVVLEGRREYNRVGCTYSYVELGITQCIYRLSRDITRFDKTFLECTFAFFASVVLNPVFLREKSFVSCYRYGSLTCTGILANHMQALVKEIFVLFPVSRLELIPHLGISALRVCLVHLKRQRVVSRVTGECFYQLGTETEVTGAGLAGHADDNRVGRIFPVENLVERACRNSIREVLARSQFLALGHHLLHDREGKSSLYLIDTGIRTVIPQVSYRFLLLIQITNQVDLRFRDDIPFGILLLRINGIPFQRNQSNTFAGDGVERLYRQRVSPEMNSFRCLHIYIDYAVIQGLKRTVLYGDGLGLIRNFQFEILNRRSHLYRTTICQLDNTGALLFGIILQIEFKVITALHHVSQIYLIPQVGIGILHITGNPVERNSGGAIATCRLLRHGYLDMDILIGNHAYINLIICDISE